MKNSLHAWDLALALIANGKTPFDPERIGKNTQRKRADPSYENRFRVSIVTARNAPSHERALNTLKSWGVMANDAFFLGGIEKRKVLGVLRPHIFSMTNRAIYVQPAQ